MAALAAPYRGGHHDAGVEWFTLETRYTRVHYAVRGGERPFDASGTAQRVAAIADDVLLRLGEHTGWVPRGPVHVVVSDEADRLTAYTLPAWGWVVLSADPGVEVGRYRGRRDWVEVAVAHELGHVVAERLASPWAPTASYGLEVTGSGSVGALGVGASATVGPNEPFGWSEGAAEAWSDAIGVPSWSSSRQALIRASALEDRLLGWDEWLVSVDKDDVLDAERAYQQGNAFARWLAAEYGEDVFAEMARAARRRYRGSWASVLREVTGEPARVTWARWRASVVADALADAAGIGARGLVEGQHIERVAPEWLASDQRSADAWASRSRRDREQAHERLGAFELYPQTSADGRWFGEGKVGWVHVQRGDPRDWPVRSWSEATAREDRTSATSVWVPGAFGNAYAFVPGRDVLIVTAPEDARARWFAPTPADPWLRLYAVNLQPERRPVEHRGGSVDEERLRLGPRELRRRMHPIPGTLRARDPAVSPDGTRLAWLAYADGATELVVAGIDGASPRRLPFVRPTMLARPCWSPDGARIVVSALAGERPDLWVVEVDSGRWTALTGDPADEVDPYWAADGVWFASDRTGTFDVYRLDPTDGTTLRMSRTVGGAMTPFVDRRGDLLYSGLTAHGYQAMRIPRGELAFDPVPPFLPPSPPAIDWPSASPSASPIAPRVYRWWRSPLVPGVSPMLRLDADRAGLGPSAGAFVRARDAVERFELTLQGLAGSDWLGDAALAWRGLPPEVTLFATTALDRRALADGATDTRAWSVGGLRLEQRVRDDVDASLEISGWSASRDGAVEVRSVRASAGLGAGEVPDRDDPTGAFAGLSATRAWSTPTGGLTAPWDRVELDVVGAVNLPWAVGPLDEHALRVEGRLTAGATDREVHPDEALYAGGDAPAALRLDAAVPSIPLPGFSAYALGGSTLGVAGVDLVAPLATRLRRGAGPLYLQGVDVAVGGAAAATPDSALGSAIVELRGRALLLDAPWDSVVRVAWGLGAPPLGVPGGYGAGLPEAPTGVPRLYVGLGAGF